MKPEVAAVPPERCPTPLPSSGYYRHGALMKTHAPGVVPPEPGRNYVEGLLRTSDVFLCSEDPEQALPALLTALDATIPLRALVLVEGARGERGGARARSVGATDASELARLEAHTRAVFGYLVDVAATLESAACPGLEIALPLVTNEGAIVAVLLAFGTAAASEPDLAFLDAVAAQLSQALARDRRATELVVARELAMSRAHAAASDFLRERSEHQETRAALERESFEADVLAILHEAPDPARELSRLARLVTHRIADGCVFELGVPDALCRAAATQLSAATVEQVIARLVPRVLVTRRGLVASRTRLADVLGDDVWHLDPEAIAVQRDLGLEWVVCAPVRTDKKGEILGAMLLFSGDPERGPLDLQAVERLGRSLATAIERARPYRAALLAVERRERILSIVAHDLRQPLNAMLLNVSSLIGRIPADGERRRSGRRELEAIKRSVVRMASLTGDLLDLSSVDAGTIHLACTSVAVPELIKETVELVEPLASARGVSLECPAPPSPLPAVWGDGGRLAQVLLNLVGNAIKFTPQGGNITIEPRADGDMVAISVRDTGPGIREADRAMVFERFWQAKDTAPLGSGLGLAIAKAIVEAHGGRIGVESTVGRGTTFTFTVPTAT